MIASTMDARLDPYDSVRCRHRQTLDAWLRQPLPADLDSARPPAGSLTGK